MTTVLKASVNDVRYLAMMLRGVHFVNKANITMTARGLIVVAEEARTLLGTAYIFADIFDEYEYHSPPSSSQDSQPPNAEEEQNTAFELPLTLLIECLNIFGTAGSSSSAVSAGSHRPWNGGDNPSDGGESDGGDGHGRRGKTRKPGGRSLETYFRGGSEKRTSMRMSYDGPGYPLTLLLAEDATGPTTTCEISTFDPEPQLELPFDGDALVLKIILKSSWLRDALSELDPSCSKVTFIGNPSEPAVGMEKHKSRKSNPPIFRIQATGTFGSTEMDYPNDKDVLESFDCTQPVRFSYRFGHITRALRALQSSIKTSLRIDTEGLLSLQFAMAAPVVRRGENAAAFIEFQCLALDDEVR